MVRGRRLGGKLRILESVDWGEDLWQKSLTAHAGLVSLCLETTWLEVLACPPQGRTPLLFAALGDYIGCCGSHTACSDLEILGTVTS